MEPSTTTAVSTAATAAAAKSPMASSRATAENPACPQGHVSEAGRRGPQQKLFVCLWHFVLLGEWKTLFFGLVSALHFVCLGEWKTRGFPTNKREKEEKGELILGSFGARGRNLQTDRCGHQK